MLKKVRLLNEKERKGLEEYTMREIEDMKKQTGHILLMDRSNSPEEIILGMIERSELPDEGWFHSKFFLNNIEYCDVMDVVLYYISLQDDLDNIAKISCCDFSRMLERTTKGWIERSEKKWGKVRTPLFRGHQKVYYRPGIWDIASAWTPGPGPMGGTMSAARYYEALHPGFCQHERLLSFFRYSAELLGTHGYWPYYKKHVIEAATFPKWRRKMHSKRLETVFELAESVCRALRNKK